MECKQKSFKIIELMTEIAELREEEEPLFVHKMHFPAAPNTVPVIQMHEYTKAQEVLDLRLKAIEDKCEF